MLLQQWRLYGLSPVYHAIGWADGEPFEPKLIRLLKQIDNMISSGNKVSLAGVSAGASAALTAYSKRADTITGVVCISGKIQNGGTIGEQIFQRNPAFRESMAGLPAILDKFTSDERRRIMSIHPIRDHTVPIRDTIIPGAIEKEVLAYGHIPSIFHCLLFCGPSIASFLRQAEPSV